MGVLYNASVLIFTGEAMVVPMTNRSLSTPYAGPQRHFLPHLLQINLVDFT